MRTNILDCCHGRMALMTCQLLVFVSLSLCSSPLRQFLSLCLLSFLPRLSGSCVKVGGCSVCAHLCVTVFKTCKVLRCYRKIFLYSPRFLFEKQSFVSGNQSLLQGSCFRKVRWVKGCMASPPPCTALPYTYFYSNWEHLFKLLRGNCTGELQIMYNSASLYPSRGKWIKMFDGRQWIVGGSSSLVPTQASPFHFIPLVPTFWSRRFLLRHRRMMWLLKSVWCHLPQAPL